MRNWFSGGHYPTSRHPYMGRLLAMFPSWNI
jgi:hypothetical protein